MPDSARRSSTRSHQLGGQPRRLIFVLVVLSTAFSTAFAAIVTTLYIPLTLAAFGMIARAPRSPSARASARSRCAASSAPASPLRRWPRRSSWERWCAGRLQPGAPGHRHGRRRHLVAPPHLDPRRRARRVRVRLSRRGVSSASTPVGRGRRPRRPVPHPVASARRRPPAPSAWWTSCCAPTPRCCSTASSGRRCRVLVVSVVGGLASIVLLVVRRYGLARITSSMAVATTSSAGPWPSTVPAAAVPDHRGRGPHPGRPGGDDRRAGARLARPGARARLHVRAARGRPGPTRQIPRPQAGRIAVRGGARRPKPGRHAVERHVTGR